jgi:hypothetical protein
MGLSQLGLRLYLTARIEDTKTSGSSGYSAIENLVASLNQPLRENIDVHLVNNPQLRKISTVKQAFLNLSISDTEHTETHKNTFSQSSAVHTSPSPFAFYSSTSTHNHIVSFLVSQQHKKANFLARAKTKSKSNNQLEPPTA